MYREIKIRYFFKIENIKYHCSYAATIWKLSYPSVGALRQWYNEYLLSVKLHHNHRKNQSILKNKNE